MPDPNDYDDALEKHKLEQFFQHLKALSRPPISVDKLIEDFEQAKHGSDFKKALEIKQRILELQEQQRNAPAAAPEPKYTSKDYEKAVVQHDLGMMYKIAKQLADQTTPAERELQPPEGIDADEAAKALNVYYQKAYKRTYHPASNLQNIPRQEEPVPQVDNGETLNISGAVSAISVNNFERHDPLPPDANGNPIEKVTKGYRLTVTIDTFDVETVKKLMMIRTKQMHGKVTADLIVWPL